MKETNINGKKFYYIVHYDGINFCDYTEFYQKITVKRKKYLFFGESVPYEKYVLILTINDDYEDKSIPHDFWEYTFKIKLTDLF